MPCMRQLTSSVCDLASTHADIAAQWHPSLNGAVTAQTVVGGSSMRYCWRCPDGHDYRSRVSSRINGRVCPVCAGQRVNAGYNDLGTTHPHLGVEWDRDGIGSLTPENVIAGSSRRANWICPLGHRYSKTINRRLKVLRASTASTGWSSVASMTSLRSVRSYFGTGILRGAHH